MNIQNSFLDGENHSLKAVLHSQETLFQIIESMPLYMNLWNSKTENVMCNSRVKDLFGIESEEQYLNDFYKFSPEFQPDGRPSISAAHEYIDQARENGGIVFNWLHCDINKEEIPAEITLKLLPISDENGNPFLVGFIRDLRSTLLETQKTAHFDDFYFNQLSDKIIFSILAEFSDECFFVYEIETSYLQCFGKGREILELPSEKIEVPQNNIFKKLIYPEDLYILEQLIASTQKGYVRPCDLRIVMPDSSIRYHKVVYNIIKDSKGDPKYSTGKILDIHEQKSFEALSQRDLLTNCYNKITSENLIQKVFLEDYETMHSLLIIDIDNFKSINDNLGHHFGDLVLKEIGEKLHKNFRDLDIVGRIGGDEFIVLIKEASSLEIVKKRAEVISKALRCTYSSEHHEYKISGSIGIAMYPKDGKSFEELYKAADKALYKSKSDGKDRYTFYSDELINENVKNLTILENANRMANTYFDSELVSTVFDLMYETTDVNFAINAVLQRIGLAYKLDRCYLYESVDEGENYRVNFEWCNEGIPKEKDLLKKMSKDEYSEFFDALIESNLIYSNDIDTIEDKDFYKAVKKRGVKAYLHLQIKNKDSSRLLLGLEDCTSARNWSEKDINSLTYALKMISIFLFADSIVRKECTIKKS